MKDHFEIDCRKCKNCDTVNIGCKLYGNDAKKAIAKCASTLFIEYKKTPVKVIKTMLQDRRKR